jgi:hypothetical protein
VNDGVVEKKYEQTREGESNVCRSQWGRQFSFDLLGPGAMGKRPREKTEGGHTVNRRACTLAWQPVGLAKSAWCIGQPIFEQMARRPRRAAKLPRRAAKS